MEKCQTYCNFSRVTARKVDVNTARLLNEKYGVTLGELSMLVGITREGIRQRINANTGNASWVSNVLTVREIRAIADIVKMDSFIQVSNGLYVHIVNDGYNPCILIKNEGDIKVVFDIPNDIAKVLRDNNYHILRDIDKRFKQKLEIVEKNGKKFGIVRSQSLLTAIYNRAKQLGISKQEYWKLLGVEKVTTKSADKVDTVTDRVKEILEKHSDGNKNVHIPIDSPDYAYIVTLVNRKNISRAELAESFGYKLSNKRKSRLAERGADFYRPQIEQCRISKDSNEVYVRYRTNLYENLRHYARYHNITIEQLLEGMGYKRVRRWQKKR